MSFINEFEERIGSIFGAAPTGYTEPFSFKKLAKQAAREMEREVLVSGGIETAPALYTVLVSEADDSLMRPLYAQITEETSAYIYAQAKIKGYSFVGTPLVRFMVDPSLRSGRFAVFAENVDAATLKRLRAEEEAFLGGNSSVGGAAAQMAKPEPAPVTEPEIEFDGSHFAAEEAIDTDDFEEPFVADVATPSVAPVPVTQLRGASVVVPSIDDDADATPEPVVAKPPTCMLIDRQTGRTYKAEAPSALIGRERSQVDIVLTDPNVSRVHAQLSYDGSCWHIIDRRSTNGTLVNDVDVTECVLKSGDFVTVGLTVLEFREM